MSGYGPATSELMEQTSGYAGSDASRTCHLWVPHNPNRNTLVHFLPLTKASTAFFSQMLCDQHRHMGRPSINRDYDASTIFTKGVLSKKLKSSLSGLFIYFHKCFELAI